MRFTKLTTLVSSMATRMGIGVDADPELADARRDVTPDAVLDRIETNSAIER
jgi:hypothetical protein